MLVSYVSAKNIIEINSVIGQYGFLHRRQSLINKGALGQEWAIGPIDPLSLSALSMCPVAFVL